MRALTFEKQHQLQEVVSNLEFEGRNYKFLRENHARLLKK